MITKNLWQAQFQERGSRAEELERQESGLKPLLSTSLMLKPLLCFALIPLSAQKPWSADTLTLINPRSLQADQQGATYHCIAGFVSLDSGDITESEFLIETFETRGISDQDPALRQVAHILNLRIGRG